jgi:two-component system response regulator DesR
VLQDQGSELALLLRTPFPEAEMSCIGDRQSTVGQRVLVVDDDPSFLETMSGWIETHCNVEVVAYSSAEEAMVSATPDGFDVCVLDYELAGANGLTLGAMLRQINPGIRLILTSGELPPGIEALAHEHGFGRVFTKPLSPHDLVEAIKH